MMEVKVQGPKFITADLEDRIRKHLVKVREDGRRAALSGFYAIAERRYGEEAALSWVLEEANCARHEDRPHGARS